MTLDHPREAARRIILGEPQKPTDAAQVAGAYLLLFGKPGEQT